MGIGAGAGEIRRKQIANATSSSGLPLEAALSIFEVLTSGGKNRRPPNNHFDKNGHESKDRRQITTFVIAVTDNTRFVRKIEPGTSASGVRAEWKDINEDPSLRGGDVTARPANTYRTRASQGFQLRT